MGEGEGEAVKVFRTWSSPFGLRVIWGLKLKGVEFETIYEDLSNKSELLLQYNPIQKKIPVLIHNGKPICDSLVILEYIEETWNQSPLLPQDPHQRAMARFWAKFGDEKVFPPARAIVFNEGKELDDSVAEVLKSLTYLEEELQGKKFFGGEKIGFADLALGWIGYYINIFEEMKGLKVIDTEKFPMLVSWIKEFSDIPIIHENWPEREKLIARFDKMKELVQANKTTLEKLK